MPSRQLRLFAVASSILPLLIHAYAGADSKDGEAAKLGHEAIMADYLAMKFDAAVSKLEKAIQLCGADQCGKATVARLHRDLGTVLVAGLGKVDQGKSEFKLALKADPTIELDKDLASDQVTKAFSEAKAAAGDPKADAAAGAAPGAVKPVSGAPAAAGKGQPATAGTRAGGGVEASATASLGGDSAGEASSGNPDCPPDFPGCGPGGEGSSCKSDSDCKSGLSCYQKECRSDEAVNKGGPAKRNQASLGFQIDAMMIGAEKNVCDGGNAYNCFFSGGIYYAGNPNDAGPNPAVTGNEITKGGFAASTKRILLGYDRRLGRSLSLGGRVGFALGGGPKTPTGAGFLPIHLEARAAYWFGNGVFSPYAFVAAGLGQTDGRVSVDVVQTLDTVDNNGNTVARAFPGKVTLTAWRTAGLAFANLGAGAMFKVTPSLAPFVELKLGQLFPTMATVASAQVGGAFLF